MSKGMLLCFNSFPWGAEGPFPVHLMKGGKERRGKRAFRSEGSVRESGGGEHGQKRGPART